MTRQTSGQFIMLPVGQIVPAPVPVRTKWDEEGLRLLAASEAERGNIVPVRVRKLGPGVYQLIGGHRRWRGMKLAGAEEIAAVIVECDDEEAYFQAGLENFAEDMSTEDKARWIAGVIKQKNWSMREMEQQTGIPSHTISDLLNWQAARQAGVIVRAPAHTQDEGVKKTLQIQRALPGDLEAQKAVAKAVSGTDLNRDQVRAVAEAYAKKPTQTVLKEALAEEKENREKATKRAEKNAQKARAKKEAAKVETKKKEADGTLTKAEKEYLIDLDFAKEPEKTSEQLKKHEENKRALKEATGGIENIPRVKYLLDRFRYLDEAIGETRVALKSGMFSPEARRFLANKVRRTSEKLASFADELESK